jgi:hypothetical protein
MLNAPFRMHSDGHVWVPLEFHVKSEQVHNCTDFSVRFIVVTFTNYFGFTTVPFDQLTPDWSRQYYEITGFGNVSPNAIAVHQRTVVNWANAICGRAIAVFRSIGLKPIPVP